MDFRPLLLNVSQGYFVNILRVRKQGILCRHRHTGPVHALTLKGRWHYLEHDWWADQGSYAFEPPGDIHTLEVSDDVAEMQTLFHVTGAYVYVDPDGEAEAIEDVFSAEAGLYPATLEHLIRCSGRRVVMPAVSANVPPPYLIAIGFSGEPTARVKDSDGPQNRNS